MSADPRSSSVFKSGFTLVLRLSTALSIGIFIFYIAPALEFEVGLGSVSVGYSSLLIPVLSAFTAFLSIALAIAGRRLWLLHFDTRRQERDGA